MTPEKPSYDELVRENLQLKLQLANSLNSDSLCEDLRLKNLQLVEMNEELQQTFDQFNHKKEELEKVEKQYKILASNISDVIWIMDLNGKFNYISPSAELLYGYKLAELDGLTLKDLLTSDSFIKFSIEISNRFEKEKRGEITGEATYLWKQRRKSGEEIWTEIVSNPLRDENNRLYGLLGVTRDITLRKLTEEKMNMLSVAVEQSPNSIVITKLDGSIEYVNSTFTRITGYSFEEVVGKNPKILKSGQTSKKTYKKLWKAIQSGTIWHGEFINKKKNGELYWESATIAPIKASDGTITNFVAIKDNITSKKFDEQNLRKSQERFKLLSDISLEGIMIYENGKIIDVSQSLVRITGFSQDELIGKDPVPYLFTPESVVLINEKIQIEYPFPFEVKCLEKSGKPFPVEFEMKQLKYKGRDMRVVAIRDLSYRKRVDEVLRSSLRLTEMLVDKSEQQIIEWGLEEAERLSESNCAFFHYINDDQETIKLVTWSKKTQENCFVTERSDHYPISKAGTWIDSFHERKPVVHNNYQSLKHKQGIPEGHFPLHRYISIPVIEGKNVKIIFGVGNKNEDYNQFDVDVLLFFTKTIWMVIQRKRAEQMLSEANETKSKFLSIISHDLRSPVGSIYSLTEMMLENPAMIALDEMVKFIEVINQTSKSTYDQLENMLTWSRAQNQRLEFIPVKIDINQFISKQLVSIEYLSNKKAIKIIFEPEIKADVYADTNMLTSILRNLLSNSIKFTPQNGQINLYTKLSGQNFVEIQIVDNGIGIEPERAKNIFNIGKSTSTFGTDNEKGSGLGLLLCKEFVEKNGGEIWVNSEPGKGSSFNFTLPLVT
jgi:PAS domain S-box-containing protein